MDHSLAALLPPIELESRLLARGYSIDHRIGKGGFATVYQGTFNASGEQVALKAIALSEIFPDDKPLLENELDACRSLSHKSVAQVKEIFRDEKYIIIVMEYFDGGDLLAYVNTLQISESNARVLFIQVLDAVRYAHTKGFAHLDIKLENILLSSMGRRAALCDWGLCARIQPNTMLQTTRGSLFYSCPELLKRHPFNPRLADVWGLGVILFAMVSNKLPFMAESAKGMLLQMQEPIAFPDNISADCCDIIARMLEPDPEKRISVDKITKHPWLLPSSEVRVSPVPPFRRFASERSLKAKREQIPISPRTP